MKDCESLFTRYSRDYPGKKPIAMPIFEYVCRSQEPEIDTIRNDWDKMFNEIPASDRPDVKARFCSNNEIDHISAAFEIFLYSFFYKLGFNPIVHTLGGSSRADLLVKNPENCEILVEALCLFRFDYDYDDISRKEVLDALRTIKSRYFSVAVAFDGASTGTPSTRRITTTIKQWLSDLDYNTLLANYKTNGHEALRPISLDESGLRISIKALPLDVPYNTENNLNFIYFPYGDDIAIRSDIHERIREKFHKKAQKKYGNQNYPVYLAANIFDFGFEADDAFNALLGDELVYFSRHGSKSITSIDNLPPRKSNGFWRAANGKLINSSINGCIFFDNLRVDNHRTMAPFLVYNPYLEQEKHFEEVSFFKQYIPDAEKGEYRCAPGRSIQELFDPK